MPSLKIALFADVVCPWCFIGSERLRNVLAARGTEATIEHRPFLLDPETPPEGYDLWALLRKKYGLEPERIIARPQAAALESGIPLDLGKVRRGYATVRAHTLLRHAGPRGTQRELLRALYGAYFHDALDISDVAVLESVAAAHGFSPGEAAAILDRPGELEATRAQAERAKEMGIRGVPFFVFQDWLAVSGAQPEEVLSRALAAAEEPEL